MDRFTREDLRRLIGTTADAAISIYMPTYRTGRDVRQNSIRFKNLLQQASGRLAEWGTENRAIKQLLSAVAPLEHDEVWWQQQSDGLAMFVSAGEHRKYRLPRHFDELVAVNNRYYVKPLIPLLQSDGRFYILAVSQNSVRLFEGSHFTVAERAPETLPSDLRSALNIDEYVNSLQHHTANVGTVGAGGSLFHGHGASDMDVRKKDEILQFFRRINDGLKGAVESHDVPLLFMGVDYLFPIFEEACDYKGLVATPATGNPELWSVAEIHQRAWAVVAPVFDEARCAALGRYHDLAGSNRVTHHYEKVVQAAHLGQIDTLLAVTDAEIWGAVDESSGSVTRSRVKGRATEDLMNYAVLHTLLNSGKVYSLPREQMPDGCLALAILRFPLPQPGV